MAVAVALETSQPSVSGHEEVTPASLFSLTGYSRVTVRARPPGFGSREGCVNLLIAHVT